MKSLLTAIATGLALVLCACGQPQTEEEKAPEAGKRYARSFDRAIYGAWIPENRVPETPADGPEQVIWEVSRYPDQEPTPEQVAAAEDLRQRSLEAATRNGWFEYAVGMADGYERQWRDETHYYKWEYIKDDAILDPEKPEYLMYYDTEDGQVLAGFMFLVNEPMGEGPQPGGPLTVWHYHLASHPHCFREGMVLMSHPEGGRCYGDDVLSTRSPEMVHVWFVNHPEGRFATRMKLDPEMLRQAIAEQDMSCCTEE